MRIERSKVTYKFGNEIPAAVTIKPGEPVILETQDASGGRIRSVKEAYSYIGIIDEMNPATGPLYIIGAEPGDTLVVNILDITTDSKGYRVLLDSCGVITDQMNVPCATMVEINNNFVFYEGNIKLPLRPMIGVIGTAPSGQASPTLYPGRHGGNMDLNEITKGSLVYLPVKCDGALLAIGDIHASMGDGELTGGGIDIAGEVIINISLIKGKSWEWPWIETNDNWVSFACAKNLEAAIRIATMNMVELLTEKLGTTKEIAFMLIGSHGDIRIGQAGNCGIDVTVGLKFPKIG